MQLYSIIIFHNFVTLNEIFTAIVNFDIENAPY
jgi:hypothetical protein